MNRHMELKFLVERLQDVAVVNCSGRMVRGTALDEFRRRIEQLECVRVLVLDVSEVEQLDAGGLGALLQVRRWATQKSAKMKLVNPPLFFRRLLEADAIDVVMLDLAWCGGLTEGRKIAALAEAFQVQTAWHGPADVGPPTHAANVHVDISIPNFGVQEMVFFPEATQEVIPGAPEYKDGYLMVRETPGLGTDVNEELAKKYPYHRAYLPTARRKDGSVQDW